MTGYELLRFLTEAPREALEQEILFEVVVSTAPDHQFSGHVPVIEGRLVHSDLLLVPDQGFLTPEQAMENFNRIKQEIANGEYECSEEALSQYMPSNCPQILSKGQVLMKLQRLQGYSEAPVPEPEENPAMHVSWGPGGVA